jgi:hypothetical protein
MANSTEITISDMIQYQRCPKKFHYTSTTQLGLEKKGGGPEYFKIGTIWHDVLEKFYLGHDDIRNYFKEQVAVEFQGYDQMSDDLINQLMAGIDLIRDYEIWAADYATFEVVSTEERHAIRLNAVTPGLFFSFKYDLLVKIDGYLWLVDFKTSAGKLPTDPSVFEFSDQALAYQWALSEVLDEHVAGAIFIYINKKPPTSPELTKKGLTKRKNLRSTPNTYLDAIHDNNLDPNDYKETLQLLTDNLDGKFFKRVDVIGSGGRRTVHKQKVIDFGNRILNNDLHIYTTQSSMECRICEFLEPCQLVQMGLDDTKLLEMQYQKRQPRD